MLIVVAVIGSNSFSDDSGCDDGDINDYRNGQLWARASGTVTHLSVTTF